MLQKAFNFSKPNYLHNTQVQNIALLLLLLIMPIATEAQIDSLGLINCGFTDISPEETLAKSTCLFPNTNFWEEDHLSDLIPQGIQRNLKIKTNILFVQREDGSGNFDKNNAEHMAWFDQVFTELNNRLEHLIQSSLSNGCYSSPLFYENIHVEFIPNYIEIRDEYHWNHLNDPQPSIWNSYNKQFLMEIHELAKLQENYQDGFDVIITTNEDSWTLFNEQNIPMWIINETVPDPYNGASYSSHPTYDLDHPAMMHMPNLFLLYLNTIQFIPWDYDIMLNYAAGALLHEYFHYFNLTHTSDPINIMNQSGKHGQKIYEYMEM